MTAARSTRPPPAPVLFLVAGIGASAGGIEASSRLLEALPNDTGVAYVFVLHLDPHHESALGDILGRVSSMPVRTIADRMLLRPNEVYVNPPDADVTVSGGRFVLVRRGGAREVPRIVDGFLRSLAGDYGQRAMGVILSGMGHDGTVGMQEIKGSGGITFAQDATAQQDSMPRSAIAAGCVDAVLPPLEIAREIARIARHPLAAAVIDPSAEPALPEGDFNRVLDILRNVREVDFGHYKRNTLKRRIGRRVMLHRLDGLAEYARMLEDDPVELEALYQDVLISVTSFFRNPEAFESLREQVFPRLVENRPRNTAIRIWVQGCSTGEEAYSIAIALTEYLEARDRMFPLQVFATDVNGVAIDKARVGIFPKGIAQDVSAERLRRFFSEVDGAFRIAKSIREQCVFAQHNVLSAPPFSRIDLVTCRNLMIYLDAEAQQKLLSVFYYALNLTGFLWLGSSETIGSHRDVFEPLDGKSRVYRRRSGRLSLTPPIAFAAPAAARSLRVKASPPIEGSGAADAQKEADRVLLSRYSPAAVLVTSTFDILQFRGDTGPYLTPSPGRASLNLLKMLRDGLMVAVRGALHRAKKRGAPVREGPLKARGGDEHREVVVEVIPVGRSDDHEGCLLVVFEEAGGPAGALHAARESDAAAAAMRDDDPEREVIRLNQELTATREYLQSVIEQQEAANEELQSANEEVQSANEELQSINEELETSKEEIQSSNEELATVNEELQNRNGELGRANDDFTNLLASVQIAIVMLGPDLRIRRFTPAAEKLLNLISADVGRPLGDIRLNIDLPELERMLLDVVESATPLQVEALDKQGRWFSVRVRPYRTLENRIDGAVLILVDIDNLKRGEESLRADISEQLRARASLLEADRSKNQFLAMLAHELRNPLAPLQAVAELLRLRADDAEARERVSRILSRQVGVMARMFDDLLDVSRITQGKVELRYEVVALEDVVQGAIALTPAIGDRRQQVEVQVPSDIYIRVDPVRLEQVLGNLLGNAAKFTPPGGRIGIAAEVVVSGVEIRVSDTGIGMTPEVMAQAFDLFMQADRSMERTRGGLGIGLTVVRSLTELHGGTVEASSSGPGQGSAFTIRLPKTVLASRAVAAVEHGSEPAAKAALRPRRILVVDDNQDSADLWARLLTGRSHQTMVANDGPSAIEQAALLQPDVVLLDIGLPGLDGFEVARRLRAMPETAGALILATSGYSLSDEQNDPRTSHFDGYFTKPVAPSKLIERIEAWDGPSAAPKNQL